MQAPPAPGSRLGPAARPGRCGGRCSRRCPGPKAAQLSSRNLRALRTDREAFPLQGEGSRGTKPSSQRAAAGSPRATAPAPPADCAGCSGSRGHACAARDLGRGTRVRPPACEGLRREQAAWRSRESARAVTGRRGASGARATPRRLLAQGCLGHRAGRAWRVAGILPHPGNPGGLGTSARWGAPLERRCGVLSAWTGRLRGKRRVLFLPPRDVLAATSALSCGTTSEWHHLRVAPPASGGLQSSMRPGRPGAWGCWPGSEDVRVV